MKKPISTHSLNELKSFHKEATKFFASELILLKKTLPKIVDDRLAKPSVLLMSCGQTGAALLQLSNQVNRYNDEVIMLARAFMEIITNFCYVGICDEREYRAFILHPIYKQYHNIGSFKMEDGFDNISEKYAARKEFQDKLKKKLIVKEALTMFSETNPHLNWTKKTLSQRIDVIIERGNLLDDFFTIIKHQYYSDASETLHGSLYGCGYGMGAFDPEFDRSKKNELAKKLYKNSTCVLLHLGMLIHESFTLISYSNDIEKIWKTSFLNRGQALSLLFYVLEITGEEYK
ncbi:MAG: hypothetical protein CVU05_09015 [Bacteroidetes bacterium HGW-Bacteroidetes-21]|jgi:hypothetical protein|nr:MAG: hypothetical protein CVU05_09015 [Bacteroidetes bacterium HGW-Bacteroidetes-21]